MARLQYSSGVMRGCYYSIEPQSASEISATVITPASKKTTIVDSIESAKSWVDKQVRMYLAGAFYYYEA